MFCVRPPLKEPPEGDCTTHTTHKCCNVTVVFLALQAPGAAMSACTDLAKSRSLIYDRFIGFFELLSTFFLTPLHIQSYAAVHQLIVLIRKYVAVVFS